MKLLLWLLMTMLQLQLVPHCHRKGSSQHDCPTRNDGAAASSWQTYTRSTRCVRTSESDSPTSSAYLPLFDKGSRALVKTASAAANALSFWA